MLTLVLLPGLDGTGQLFAPFLGALGGEFKVQVIAYPANEPLGYAELAARVRAELPREAPYVLLGESFSGPVAMLLAASAPQQLKGLVLCCTFARTPRPALAWLRALLPVLPMPLAGVTVLGQVLLGQVLLGQVLLGRHAGAALLSTLRESLRGVASDVIRARLRAVLTVDVTAALAALKLPVCYLRATQDVLVPASASRQILMHRPDAEVVALAAPHFLLQTVPADAAAVVARFMRACASAG